MIHVRPADRIVAGFDVAIVGGEIERRPAAFVGEIRIGAVIEQIRGEFVVAVLRRGEQRGPAVVGGLVDIGAGGHQIDRALKAAFARGENQRGHAAAVFGCGSAEESEIVGHRGSSLTRDCQQQHRRDLHVRQRCQLRAAQRRVPHLQLAAPVLLRSARFADKPPAPCAEFNRA